MRTILTQEQNARIRDVLAKVVREKYDDNLNKAAQAMQIPQSTLHRFITGNMGTSPQTAAIIAREAGISVGEMMEEDGDTERREMAVARALSGRTPITPLEEIPGFRESLAEIMPMTDHGHKVWARVARLHLAPPPVRVTPMMLLKAAEMVSISYSDQLSAGSDEPPPSRSSGRGKSVSRLRRR